MALHYEWVKNAEEEKKKSSLDGGLHASDYYIQIIISNKLS